MIKSIGILCVIGALILDIASYYRQIAKILKTKKSSQVSSTAYLFKIGKAKLALVGLIMYANWVGVVMEVVMILVYIGCLIIIAKYKPKNWRLI